MCEANTSYTQIYLRKANIRQYYQVFFTFFKHKSTKILPRYNGDLYFIGKCRTNESVFDVICIFVTKMYCRCRNLNCRTVGYKHREILLVASKYCQTVNCRTIEVSDCEIRLYLCARINYKY